MTDERIVKINEAVLEDLFEKSVVAMPLFDWWNQANLNSLLEDHFDQRHIDFMSAAWPGIVKELVRLARIGLAAEDLKVEIVDSLYGGKRATIVYKDIPVFTGADSTQLVALGWENAANRLELQKRLLHEAERAEAAEHHHKEMYSCLATFLQYWKVHADSEKIGDMINELSEHLWQHEPQYGDE